MKKKFIIILLIKFFIKKTWFQTTIPKQKERKTNLKFNEYIVYIINNLI